MNRSFLLQHGMTLAAVYLLCGLVTASTHAADTENIPQTQPSTGASITVAVGSVEDSLKACLARIPKGATAGQRMLAEQSCKRDENERKPFQASDIR